VLPNAGSSTPPPRVATVQPDGSIKLDFGDLQQGSDTVYSNVLGLTSKSNRTSTLTLSLSGTLAKLVKHIGFYGKAGFQTTNLTLKAGQTQQLAFELSASSKAALGKQQGSFTLTATLSNRKSQVSQLSMAVEVVDPPSASPSPSPSVSAKPSSSPSATPTATQSPSVTPSPSSTQSVSPLPTVAPSTSPSVSSQPAASPSSSASPSAPSVILWLAPLCLVLRLF
jgi:hypothetical protein